MDRLVATASGCKDAARKAFGELYAQLARLYAGEAGFDPFRRILRDCILDTWPIASGKMILGEVLDEHRSHSITSVCEELGAKRDIEAILEDLGVLEPNDPRPDSRRVFDARRHARLLEEIAALVGLRALRPAMGVSRAELEALIKDEVIRPFTNVPSVKTRWRLAAGLAPVEELQAPSVPVRAGAPGWEPILRARRRKRIGSDAIIAAIRNGHLVAGRSPEREGFGGIVVREDEINRLVAAQAPAHGPVPAATFGVSVGIKHKGRFLALIAAGHTPATRMRHPQTGRVGLYMSEADIAAFHRRFTTFKVLRRERGGHSKTLRTRLKVARVPRFSPGGADFGLLYLRIVVEAALL